MAFTDQTAVWVYKKLLTYQDMSNNAINDKLFNDQLTGAIDIPNDLKLANAKYLRGEIAATGTWYKLCGLDAGNIVQLGDALTEVRVPADPTNALGVATKQYVDAKEMYQTQPKVAATGGANNVYANVLNITKKGRVQTLSVLDGGGGGAGGVATIRITIDGGTPVVIATSSIAANKYRFLQANLIFNASDQSTEDLVSSLLEIGFNTSLLIESKSGNALTGDVVNIVYEIIP